MYIARESDLRVLLNKFKSYYIRNDIFKEKRSEEMFTVQGKHVYLTHISPSASN